MKIPIISLWNPWAALVVHGEKRIESRSWQWPKSHGLPSFLAIHAARKWNGGLAALAGSEPFRSALASHGIGFARSGRSRVSMLNVRLGCVVGVVRIVECVATVMLPVYLDAADNDRLRLRDSLAAKYLRKLPNEREFGDYRYGRYAWVFDRNLAIEPIELAGHQSLWSWEPTAEVREWMEKATVAGVETW